jgi:hypothetical protein
MKDRLPPLTRDVKAALALHNLTREDLMRADEHTRAVLRSQFFRVMTLMQQAEQAGRSANKAAP